MIRGVGVLHTISGKDSDTISAISKLVKSHVETAAKLTSGAPVRATMVVDKSASKIVLVEEWETSTDHSAYVESEHGINLDKRLEGLVLEPLMREFFPETLHICKEEVTKSHEDVGVLVRQKTSSSVNGAKLRDAQKAAYEKQIELEPGCTCCVILAGSPKNLSQVRIIELWRSQEDIHFHESSQWHAEGEEKVIPLVTDMDCDSVVGSRLLF